MVRSVTVFDEDWTEEDMAAALEQAHEERVTCRGCGLPLDETMDPAREYDVELLACRACAVGDQIERRWREAKSNTDGLRKRIFEVD